MPPRAVHRLRLSAQKYSSRDKTRNRVFEVSHIGPSRGGLLGAEAAALNFISQKHELRASALRFARIVGPQTGCASAAEKREQGKSHEHRETTDHRTETLLHRLGLIDCR